MGAGHQRVAGSPCRDRGSRTAAIRISRAPPGNDFDALGVAHRLAREREPVGLSVFLDLLVGGQAVELFEEQLDCVIAGTPGVLVAAGGRVRQGEGPVSAGLGLGLEHAFDAGRVRQPVGPEGASSAVGSASYLPAR